MPGPALESEFSSPKGPPDTVKKKIPTKGSTPSVRLPALGAGRVISDGISSLILGPTLRSRLVGTTYGPVLGPSSSQTSK